MNRRNQIDPERMVRRVLREFTRVRSYDEIKRSVDEIRRGVNDAMRDFSEPREQPRQEPPRPQEGPQTGPRSEPQAAPQTGPQAVPPRQNGSSWQTSGGQGAGSFFNSVFRQKKEPPRFPLPSRVKGVLFLVFGILGAVAFGLGAVGTALAAALLLTELVPLAVFFGVLAVGFLGASLYGGRELGLVRRFSAYCRALGQADFCTVQAMSSGAGVNVKKAAKDLAEMIRRGWFPHGHLDSGATTFMADEETYRQYLLAEQSRAEREKERAERAAPVHTGNEELDEVIREGKAYIQRISDANDAIPGLDVSRKLDEIEDVCIRIFAVVEHNPEKLPEIRRFLNYYLPTTLKLLDAYREFDKQPVQGETVRSAKREIEETLDTIVAAFRSLLDSLYEKDAMDISADISVLRTMFAREGLTGSDFKPEKGAQEEQKTEQPELKL